MKILVAGSSGMVGTALVSALAGVEVIETFKPAWGDPTWFPMPDLQRFSAAERAFFMIDRVGARLGMGDVIAIIARKR